MDKSMTQEWRKDGAFGIDVGHKKCPQCYDTGSRDLLFDAHNAALKAAKYGTPELADRVSDLTVENDQFYKRAEKAEAELAAEREKVNRCEVVHRHRETIELLKGQIKPLVDALQMLVDHQNGCPLPKYEAGWNKAMELSNAALASVKEEK